MGIRTSQTHTGNSGRNEVDTETGELVPVHSTQASAEILLPANAVELKRAFDAYHSLCEQILEDSDRQIISGKPFTKRSGWRKLSCAYNVQTEIVSKEVHRDEEGRVIWAEFVVKAIAPNGRYAEGEGSYGRKSKCCPQGCSKGGKHKHCPTDCDGWRHFSDPVHDIAATAHTRAVNRACADLFGLGEVSAEEIGDAGAYGSESPKRQGQKPSQSRAKSKKPSGAEPTEEVELADRSTRVAIVKRRQELVDSLSPEQKENFETEWALRDLPAPMRLEPDQLERAYGCLNHFESLDVDEDVVEAELVSEGDDEEPF